MIFDRFRNKIKMEIILVVFKISDLNKFVNMMLLIFDSKINLNSFSFLSGAIVAVRCLGEYENEM